MIWIEAEHLIGLAAARMKSVINRNGLAKFTLVIRDRAIAESRAGPTVGLRSFRFFFETLLIDFDAKTRTRRQADVAVIIELPRPAGEAFLIEARVVGI